MNRMCNPQSDTDRLYIQRMEGERGLLSIADCIETEEQNLSISTSLWIKIIETFQEWEDFAQYEVPVPTAKKQKGRKI